MRTTKMRTAGQIIAVLEKRMARVLLAIHNVSELTLKNAFIST